MLKALDPQPWDIEIGTRLVNDRHFQACFAFSLLVALRLRLLSLSVLPAPLPTAILLLTTVLLCHAFSPDESIKLGFLRK